MKLLVRYYHYMLGKLATNCLVNTKSILNVLQLLEDSDNEGDADSEYSEQQSGLEKASMTPSLGSHHNPSTKTKKKKKKKKKKTNTSAAEKTDASEDLVIIFCKICDSS